MKNEAKLSIYKYWLTEIIFLKLSRGEIFLANFIPPANGASLGCYNVNAPAIGPGHQGFKTCNL